MAARTSLSRVAAMSLPEQRALYFLLTAIAELEDQPKSFARRSSLLFSIECLVGPLTGQRELFHVSHTLIGRMMTGCPVNLNGF